MLSKSPLIGRVGKLIPPAIKPLLVKAFIGVQKIEIEFYSRNVRPHPAPIFVLGNQKSGTSVVAALLGEMTALSVSVDLVKEYLSTGQTYPRLRRGEFSFSRFIERNRLDFSRDIIKEANLTVFYDELASYFPKSRFVFVLRDPRDNIKSQLNRRNIPGDLAFLDHGHKKKIKRSWHIILDGTWLGLKGNNYIEMLAARWNLLVDVYLKNKEKMVLIRYEEFLKDKIGEISRLAQRLGLSQVNDISDKVDIPYQPPGDRHVDWQSFFGVENLERIERICRDNMNFLGYPLI